MPWCSTCDRFLSPPTVQTNGTCPTCGRAVDPRRAAGPDPNIENVAPGTEPTTDEPLEPVPWHLKLLLVALAIYLAYRAFQGVTWLVAHL